MSGSEEVTISQTQGITFKVTRAAELLENTGSVTITAINTAISSAVSLVELLKHRVKGLHQVNSFEKVPNTNKTRVVFKLSYKSDDLSSSGYQKPIPESEVQEKSLAELKIPPWGERTVEKKEGNTETPGGETREFRGERRGFRRGRRGGWRNRGRGYYRGRDAERSDRREIGESVEKVEREERVEGGEGRTRRWNGDRRAGRGGRFERGEGRTRRWNGDRRGRRGFRGERGDREQHGWEDRGRYPDSRGESRGRRNNYGGGRGRGEYSRRPRGPRPE